MLAILTVFQLTYDPEAGPTAGIGGTLLMAVVCPMPLGLLGLALTAWGFSRRRSAIEAALPAGAPMA